MNFIKINSKHDHMAACPKNVTFLSTTGGQKLICRSWIQIIHLWTPISPQIIIINISYGTTTFYALLSKGCHRILLSPQGRSMTSHKIGWCYKLLVLSFSVFGWYQKQLIARGAAKNGLGAIWFSVVHLKIFYHPI